MEKMTVFLVLAVFLLGRVAISAPVSETVKVDRVALGTGVENREPMGETKEFMASVNRVYHWSKISAANVPTEIKHVWYAGGKKEAEVSLPVKYVSMRTWSSKAVWPGQWKVEIVDSSGHVISSTEFVVKRSAKE